jgi:hypothetical protein
MVILSEAKKIPTRPNILSKISQLSRKIVV